MGISSIVTPDDLLKTEGIPPGWYPVEVIKYEEAVTKGSDAKPSDGSMNAIFTFKILDGPGAGREMKKYFNEKTLHWGKNLWAVLFPGAFDKKKGGNLTSEMFNSTVGTKLKVYIKKDKEGKYDQVEDYQPLS